MPIDFPDSPTNNQTFTSGIRTWTWDGSVWNLTSYGATGAQGFQGNQGNQGNQGFQGTQGNQGNQGFQGTQGNQGFQGTQGNQGFQGTQGASGDWASAQTISAKTDSYTLVTADAGKLVTVDATTDKNVTVNGTLDLSTGQRIDILRLGTGEVTIVASSATVNSTPGLKLRARYSSASLICTAADTYVLVGDLKA